jgi:hypothetical protein
MRIAGRYAEKFGKPFGPRRVPVAINRVPVITK